MFRGVAADSWPEDSHLIPLDSMSSGIYQDMTTNQLADAISRSGSFGLAHSLEVQLIRQNVNPANSEKKS